MINGDISFVNTDGGQNPRVVGVNKGSTVVFNGGMTGTKNALMLYPASGAKKRELTVKFLGDVSWTGTLYVRDQSTEIDLSTCAFNIRVVFGDITFTPLVRSDGDAGKFHSANAMRYAVDAVGHTVTLKNGIDVESYPLPWDTVLEFPVDGATGASGKMIAETQFYGCTNDTLLVRLVGNPFGTTETNRFELISVPVGSSIDPARVRLIDDFGGLGGKLVSFEVENGDVYSTLYAVVPPRVCYLASDATSQDAGKGSRIEDATAWSNGMVPQSGYDYLVAPTNATEKEKILRTPDTNCSTYTFPGDSLTIASNASLRCYVSKTFHIDDLRMLDGSAFYEPKFNTTVTGNIDINGFVRIGTYSGMKLLLENSFTGSGTIDFGGNWIASNAIANYYLGGDNSGFLGKMLVRTAYQDGNIEPTLKDDYGLLYVGYAYNLGGDLAELTPDALTLTDFGYLWCTNDITITKSSNRGITVRGAGRIWESSGFKARVETPLTVDGTCMKFGTGTLVLAGVTEGVTGGGADSFGISNGVLRVAGTFRKLALGFAYGNGAGLQIASNAEDAEFTAKGIDLSGIDSPITLDASYKGKLPLSDLPENERGELTDGPRTIGLFTVKATEADALRAMLPARPPRLFRSGVRKWVEQPDESAGTVTFAASYGGGLVILLK